jgi:hypothetical protein
MELVAAKAESVAINLGPVAKTPQYVFVTGIIFCEWVFRRGAHPW